MTDERLAEIEARNKARTPGRWIYIGGEVRAPEVADNCFVVDAHGGVQSDDDGKFIVFASEDIPDLLAEVKRLKAKKNQILAELRHVAAVAYQIAGQHGESAPVLDNFSALAQGKMPPHSWDDALSAATQEDIDESKALADNPDFREIVATALSELP